MTFEHRPVAGREVVAAERPALSALIAVGALIAGFSNIEAVSAKTPDPIWAHLKEDRMKNPFLVFWPNFGPMRAPGAPGTAPVRTLVQVAPKIHPGDQF